MEPGDTNLLSFPPMLHPALLRENNPHSSVYALEMSLFCPKANHQCSEYVYICFLL